MFLDKSDYFFSHFLIKQNRTLNLFDNIVKIQSENTFAELIFRKSKAEPLCVGILN